MFLNGDGPNRFEPFDRIDLTYRIINEQPLEATVLVPKTLQSQPSDYRPILVHWHGGGFIVGHRIYYKWFATWALELAISNNAIIISPDYRLLPESEGVDIMSDISTFWTWLHTALPGIATAENWHSKPDLTKIACYGQSSGGYLAVQSALLNLPADVNGGSAGINCIITTSAPLNADVPSFKVPRPRALLGKRPPAPRQAEAVIQNYLRAMKPGQIRTGCDPADPIMWELVMCIFQRCYIPRLFGYKKKGNEDLDIMKMLDKSAVEDGEKSRMPALWVVHGEKDSMVPFECSSVFVEKMKKILPHVPLHFSAELGDHSFDVDETMKTSWIHEGCEFVEKYWP